MCDGSLPPSQIGGNVKSDYAQTIAQHTSLSSYTTLRHFHSLPQPDHVTAFHPLKVIIYQSAGGWSDRTQSQSKMAALNSILCTRALHSFPSYAHPPSSSLCHPRPQSKYNNNNKHNVVAFYKRRKKYDEIELTLNKIDLNNRKIKNHPPSLKLG